MQKTHTTVDLSMANLFHAFSELRASTLHGLLQLFYVVYRRYREGTLVKNEGKWVRIKTLHLPPLSQGVKKMLLDELAFLTRGQPKDEVAAISRARLGFTDFTQAEEQAFAIIEKSFNELPPKVQEIVAKALHRKCKERHDRALARVLVRYSEEIKAIGDDVAAIKAKGKIVS